MAAKTPATVRHLSSGNGVSVILASFADIDDADTWTGPKGAVTVVATDKTGTTTTGLSASVDSATGIVTFKTATDNKAVDLLIFKR